MEHRHTGTDAGIQRPWIAPPAPSLALVSGFPSGMTCWLKHLDNQVSSLLFNSVEHHCVYRSSASVQLKRITGSFGKGGTLLVIKAIPMWSWPSCGEFYLSAQAMHEIERIKTLRKSLAVNRSVPVAALAAADA